MSLFLKQKKEGRVKSNLLVLASLWLIGGSVWIAVAGCNRSGSSSGSAHIIRVEGSDTMVNLAQAWAEEYQKTHTDVSIQVSGGGSGVGIASLMEGVTDLANSSRKITDSERVRARENTGKEVVQKIVGMDALAIYVHPDNPLDTISIPQLAEIYGENPTITRWSQLGAENFGCRSDEITRVSRQNNSGTYHYFREAVLGANREYALGSIDQSGSKDVVGLVAKTPCAIGYSGMGYKTDKVKWLKVSKSSEQEGIYPSAEAVATDLYPISRPLMIYTLGDPSGIIKEYLDWLVSPDGQQVLVELGYVPLTDGEHEGQQQDQQATET